MLQRTLPAGFIAPCLPIKTAKLQSGSQWLHEIKHDGFRVIARKSGARVRITEAGRRALTVNSEFQNDEISKDWPRQRLAISQ
jgi:ATP-dependent DNA ligase